MHAILRHTLVALLVALPMIACGDEPSSPADGKHLFILSGQSNMAGLNPEESFTPTVKTAFKDRVIVVKDAVGGQPIRRWYKQWKTSGEATPGKIGDLYDRLMTKVTAATKDETVNTVTFVWMQGERDAKEKNADVYGEALNGLIGQLSTDLGRKDIDVVIGRLSDFDMKNERYPHWTKIRDVQVKFAEKHPRAAWVNTDDLNDGLNRKGKTIENDLHYSAEGYKTLGKRFADQAIALIDD